jgi:hypothetical protein
LLQHCALLPEFARDASYAERDELLTVADLNVASILVWGKMVRPPCA